MGLFCQKTNWNGRSTLDNVWASAQRSWIIPRQGGRPRMPTGPRAVLAMAAAGLALAACTANATGSNFAGPTPPAPSRPPGPSRPAGPAADLSQQLSGGNGVFMGEGTPPNLDRLGYVQHEYAASGTATSYTAATLPTNGEWNVTPATTAPYRTRVVVRQPGNASRFSGTVVVEWLNVSGGVDADPDWTSLSEEIVRKGDIWVGVSAQAIGVNGG